MGMYTDTWLVYMHKNRDTGEEECTFAAGLQCICENADYIVKLRAFRRKLLQAERRYHLQLLTLQRPAKEQWETVNIEKGVCQLKRVQSVTRASAH